VIKIEYDEYNGSGLGNIDIRLDTHEKDILHSEQFVYNPILFDVLLSSENIKRIVAKDCNGTVIEHQLEFLNDGNLEIELCNVSMESTACYTVDLYLERTGGMMIAIILGSIFISALFFGMGSILTNYSKMAKMTRTFSFILGYLQIVIMLGLIWAQENGNDIVPLLKANFYTISLIGFGLMMITYFLKSAEIMDLSDEMSDKSSKNNSKFHGNFHK